MSDLTDAPSHLSDTAQTAWLEMVMPDRETAASLIALEAMAVQVARARDAQRRIDEEGLVIAGSKGEPVPHPALAIERAAQGEVRKIAAERQKMFRRG